MVSCRPPISTPVVAFLGAAMPFYTVLRSDKHIARAEMGVTERLGAVGHFLASSPPWCPLRAQGEGEGHRIAVLAVILQYAWPDSKPRWGREQLAGRGRGGVLLDV